MRKNFSRSAFSRRFFLFALLGGIGGPALAGAPLRSLWPRARPGKGQIPAPAPAAKTAKPTAKPAAASIETLLEQARLGGHVSFVVADAKTGLVLESHDAARAHPPASVTKIITSLYALEALGPGYRFQTRLIATGPLQNGRINGDLVLVGGGDPVLDTDMLGGMARDLKAAGVREISDRFRVYGGALPYVRAIDASQPEHLSYNPAVSGLNLNFNRVHFQWKRATSGYQVLMDARARRYRPTVRMAKMRVVARDLPVYTYAGSANADSWTVARSALGKGGSRWLPVRRPALYAGEVFQTLARSYGIALRRGTPSATVPKGRAIVTHESEPLQVILKHLLKYSTNLTAEAIGLTATRARGGTPATLAASARVMTDWMDQKLGARRSHFVDHSGLEDANRTTAGDLVTALVREGPDSLFSHLLKPIWIRDAKGKPIKTHPVKVNAKTGTLNFVSALAGYIKAPDGTAGGTELAFAILTSDMDKRATIARADREIPRGARSWNKRSKRLQQGLIERWVALYGG